MAAVPTVTVLSQDGEGTVVINASDFDASKHRMANDVGTAGDDDAPPPVRVSIPPLDPTPAVPTPRRRRR